jgi:hypothetical protein
MWHRLLVARKQRLTSKQRPTSTVDARANPTHQPSVPAVSACIGPAPAAPPLIPAAHAAAQDGRATAGLSGWLGVLFSFHSSQ